MDRFPVSSLEIPLRRQDLEAMLRLVRVSCKLLKSPVYRELVAPALPDSALFDPGYQAVMMGYDFHLTEEGPRLIEVNTNAGGAALALRACHGQPFLTPSLRRRLLRMFRSEWQAFSRDDRPLSSVVILDEKPEDQALYPEMKRYVEWLTADGIEARIADPAELEGGAGGLTLDGRSVDMIYNRHCDFYLEDEPQISIRSAYLAGKVCLTPNPFIYGHLADKRRLVLWRDVVRMEAAGLSASEIDLLQQVVPESHLLSDLDRDSVWQDRKQLVLKPVDRFGGKGVLIGRSMSRKRYEEFEPQQTLVQQLVPPSQVEDSEGNSFKVDIRLFAWRNRGLGVAARLYQGQVTNLQTVGGGFAAVRLV